MEFHVYVHFPNEQQAQLDRIEGALMSLQTQGNEIMADLSKLTAEVARNTEVDSSAIALLTGLAAQIESMKTDPAALQALADQLKGSSNALADAVAANTPAAPGGETPPGGGETPPGGEPPVDPNNPQASRRGR